MCMSIEMLVLKRKLPSLAPKTGKGVMKSVATNCTMILVQVQMEDSLPFRAIPCQSEPFRLATPYGYVPLIGIPASDKPHTRLWRCKITLWVLRSCGPRVPTQHNLT